MNQLIAKEFTCSSKGIFHSICPRDVRSNTHNIHPSVPEEEQIVEDLQEIKSMQLVVQVIMVIVCITIAFIVLYYCCKKFRHMCTLFKYCFPFLPISRMLRTSHRTDLFIEVTNLMKGNTVWVHFMATGYFPTNIHLSRPILKGSVRIETCCCIFK